MTRSYQVRLHLQLVTYRDNLLQSLTQYLGSLKSAYEALQETFVGIDRTLAAEQARGPADYTVNVAMTRQAGSSYRVSAEEIDALIDLCDDRPDTANIVEAQSEIKAMERALAKLPDRASEVMRLMSLEGKTAREAATMLGVSVRVVAMDLQMAMQHCTIRFD